MTDSTKRHNNCEYGSRWNEDIKGIRICSYGCAIHKVRRKECLDCEHFKQRKSFVDTWLDFFEAYKKKSEV